MDQMAVREFSYKGKNVMIDQPDDQHADVTIEDRTFTFVRHGQGGLPMWMCDDAYFASPELEDAVRHLIDYWYIVTDDEHRAPPLTETHAAADHSDAEPRKPQHDH